MKSVEPRPLVGRSRAARSEGWDFVPETVAAAEVDCVHELINTVAQESPGAVALVWNDNEVTFGDLNNRANQLAQHLINLGLQPSEVIGIGLPRHPDFVLAILAVLKAGCTYAPLDVTYPRDRLRYISEASGLSLLLTTADVLHIFPGTRTLLLEEALSAAANLPSASPEIHGLRETVAYLIHTSGSTGPPKGVMVRHKSIARYVGAMRRATGVSPTDSYLHTASFSFSASVRQLMLPLSSGATVCLAATDDKADPLRLMALIKRREVTVFDTFPSYLRRLGLTLDSLPADERERLTDNSLRLILTTSEPLTYNIPHYWRKVLGRPVSFINMYGQTETCGINTIYEIPADAPDGCATVPVGKSFGSGTVRILNGALKPTDPGEEGELYVSGDCVAKGYWNEPHFTADRFLSDLPDSGDQIVYRTGDLAELLPDGNILLLGRQDRLIKLRGYRVSLNEIESLIGEQPAVYEARVKVDHTTSNEARLIAYVVASNALTSTRALRMDLAKTIPVYMVPASVIRLESFPLLPNGKVDYEALPAAPPGPQRTLPHTKLQEDLLRLWTTALGSGAIGIDDDFFESGGDSLLAASLFHDIEKLTGQKLPLTTLFSAPTVRGLAQALGDVQRKQAWSSLVTIKPSGDRAPLFCVHGVGGNVITYNSLAQYLRPDRPLYGLQAQGLDGVASPFQSIEDMAAHYLAAIREVQPAGPYCLGGYSFGGWVALEMAHQLTIGGEQVHLLALFDSHKTFESRAALREFNPATLTIRRAAFHLNRFLRSDSRLGYVAARAKTVRRRLRTRLQVGRIETAGTTSRSDPLRAVELANWTALRKYVPRKVRGRMTLLVTQGSSPFYKTPEEEWGRHADELQVYNVLGTHNAIFTEPYVQDLARTLNALLD